MTNPSVGGMPPVILVGLDTMQGLQAARILARHDVPVVGIVSNRYHYARWTNVCERILFASTSTEEVIELLEREAPSFSAKPIVIPCDDPQVWVVSRNRERLEALYHVPIPDPEVVDLLLDKLALYSHCQEVGLPIPRTEFLRSEGDAERAAAHLTFPCVVKPPNKAGKWAKHTTMKAFKLDQAADLVPFYRNHRHWTDVLIAQEWVPGPESNLFSCNAYFDASSVPLATFVARKVRQWPPRTGDSSLGVECRNDTVLSVAIDLFQSVGYRGLGYLEMKKDDRTGEMFIMEPNVGRPTGRSAIAEAGGVELLYTMYCDTVGLPLPDARIQRYTGVKWVNLRKDAQAAVQAMRAGELTFPAWLRSWRGPKAFAVWSLRDPVPFFADIAISIGRGLKRLLLRGKPARTRSADPV